MALDDFLESIIGSLHDGQRAGCPGRHKSAIVWPDEALEIETSDVPSLLKWATWLGSEVTFTDELGFHSGAHVYRAVGERDGLRFRFENRVELRLSGSSTGDPWAPAERYEDEPYWIVDQGWGGDRRVQLDWCLQRAVAFIRDSRRRQAWPWEIGDSGPTESDDQGLFPETETNPRGLPEPERLCVEMPSFDAWSDRSSNGQLRVLPAGFDPTREPDLLKPEIALWFSASAAHGFGMRDEVTFDDSCAEHPGYTIKSEIEIDYAAIDFSEPYDEFGSGGDESVSGEDEWRRVGRKPFVRWSESGEDWE